MDRQTWKLGVDRWPGWAVQWGDDRGSEKVMAVYMDREDRLQRY